MVWPMRKNILWVDGLGGLFVGILMLGVMLLAGAWLSDIYRLPLDLLWIMTAANLAYGAYSTTLASRSRRPMLLILLLVVANAAWTVVCFRWASLHWQAASWFALVHLVGEGLWVGGLAVLELRWRKDLVGATSAAAASARSLRHACSGPTTWPRRSRRR